jgi:hypothetical protein
VGPGILCAWAFLGVVSEFLPKRGMPILSHPPYPSDLELADFLLFPKLTIVMKGARCEAVSLVQQTVTREPKAMREKAFC